MVKRAKKKKGEEKKVVRKYVCPKCKSKKVHKGFNLFKFLGISKYKCDKCGYEDKIFPLLAV